MGRYNTFVASVVCPNGHEAEIDFQGYVGWPDWSTYVVSDNIVRPKPDRPKTRFLPDSDALTARSFWVYGIGTCPTCGATVNAKLDFRDGCFAGAQVVEAPSNADAYSWFTDEKDD